MSSSAPRRYATLPSWLIWTAGFISFPIAGIAAGAIAGPVNRRWLHRSPLARAAAELSSLAADREPVGR